MEFDRSEFMDRDPVLRTEIARLRIAQYNSTFGEPTFETLYISKALHTATTSMNTVQLASTKELSSGKTSLRFS